MVLAMPASPWALWLGALVVALFLFSFFWRLSRVTALLEEIKNLRLGLMGERLVAGKLEELAVNGHYVYHDAVAQGAQSAFNIDHIVVGPSGIFAVETKTRRKPDGKDGHRVEYNGAALVWPGGVDEDSPKQAANNARWLQDYLKTKLGMNLDVRPLLVIPGWFVTMTGRGTVTAVSHKQLESAVSGRTTLDARTVDLVRRQVDSLCRNVPGGV